MELNTFGFIGLGLIGGSLAKALKQWKPECRIMAYTRSESTSSMAFKEHTIDIICKSPADLLFAACDCVFLCAPVGNNIDALQQLKGVVRPDCILTDVGSVKGNIHEKITELGLEHCFIGGHPMTGSEKTGYSKAMF